MLWSLLISVVRISIVLRWISNLRRRCMLDQYFAMMLFDSMQNNVDQRIGIFFCGKRMRHLGLLQKNLLKLYLWSKMSSSPYRNTIVSDSVLFWKISWLNSSQIVLTKIKEIQLNLDLRIPNSWIVSRKIPGK